MIRRIVLGLVAGSLLALGALGVAEADDPVPEKSDPPVRLRKKVRAPEAPAPEKKDAAPAPDKKEDPGKKPAPEKKPVPQDPPARKKAADPKDDAAPAPDKKGEDVDPGAANLEEEIQKLMNRIAKNMQSATDRLAKQDPGAATQGLQENVIQDIDELIKQQQDDDSQQQQQQQQQQNQDQQNQQGKQGQQRPQPGMGQKQGKQQMRQQRRQARQQRQRGQGQQQQQANQQQQPQEQQQPGQEAGNGITSRAGKDEMNKIADLYKDIWGHLPETMRQEMDQYAREQFMPKYNELLKQYYTTLAEKGRKKGD